MIEGNGVVEVACGASRLTRWGDVRLAARLCDAGLTIVGVLVRPVRRATWSRRRVLPTAAPC